MAVLDQSTPRPLLPAVPRSERRRRGMSIFEPFEVAYQGLMANKMRSFLTMLGIIIGVAAVIDMVALGDGAALATRQTIQKLGTNRLYIRPGEQEVRGVRQGLGTSLTLRLEHADALRRQARYLTAVVPEYQNGGIRVKYQNENTVTTVCGATPEYFAVRNIEIAAGRAFTDAEVRSRARVAVLGHEVWEGLFGQNSPIGKTIRINGQSFTVVGLAKKMGGVPFGNKDDQVTIPITTAMRRVFGADRIRAISVQAVSADKMLAAEEEIERIFRKLLKTKEEDPSPVRIFNQADLMETASQQSTFLTMLLAGIALVSLIVGGIGIMNIMLVSVTERTREIGIRKAIGAKRRDILYQFLIESVTLSVVGGLAGIALGVGVSLWMAQPQDAGGLGFPMLLTLPPILVSFGSSAFVGIFFGIYPALKASALNPIEALRYE